VAADRQRPWLPWVGFAVLVVVAVAAAGFQGDAPSSARTDRPPSGLTARAAVAVVEQVDLRRGDLPPGYREVQARGAEDLDPGDRLHLCGAAVPSEAARIAGHRGAFRTRDGRRVRTEVAAYRPGGAGRAVRTLQAAGTSSPCSRWTGDPPGSPWTSRRSSTPASGRVDDWHSVVRTNDHTTLQGPAT